MLRSKAIRYVTEKITSVEDDLIMYQAGELASPVNTGTIFIPCPFRKVLSLEVTPVKYGSVSANGVAFGSVAELESIEATFGVNDLPAYTEGTTYYVGSLVNSGNVAYLCKEEHTAGAELDPTKWIKLNDQNFLKLNFTAPGAGKIAYISYLLTGYFLW